MEENLVNGSTENGQIVSDFSDLSISNFESETKHANAAKATDKTFTEAELVTSDFGDKASLLNENGSTNQDTLYNGSFEAEPNSATFLPGPTQQPDSVLSGNTDAESVSPVLPSGLDDGSPLINTGDNSLSSPLVSPAADCTPVSPELAGLPTLPEPAAVATAEQQSSELDPSHQFSPKLSNEQFDGEFIEQPVVYDQRSDSNPAEVESLSIAEATGEHLSGTDGAIDASLPTDQHYVIDTVAQTQLHGMDCEAVTPMDEFRHLLRQNENFTPSFSPAEPTEMNTFTPTATADECPTVLATPPFTPETETPQDQILDQLSANTSAENVDNLEEEKKTFPATMAGQSVDVVSTSATTVPDDTLSSRNEVSETDLCPQQNQLSPSYLHSADLPMVDTPVSSQSTAEECQANTDHVMTSALEADTRAAPKPETAAYDYQGDITSSSSLTGLMVETTESTRRSDEVNIENASSSMTSPPPSSAANVDQLPQHSNAIDVFQPPQQQQQPHQDPAELLQQQQHQPDVSLQPQAQNSGLDNRQRPLLLPLSIKTDFPAKSSEEVLSQDTEDSAVFTEPTSNASVSPSAVPVNRQSIEKVAPPEIARTVRHMFESGEMADRHQVPKRIVRIEEDLLPASCSGVFENQPSTLDDSVVRDTGEYISPRAEVQQGLTKSLLSQWQAKENQEFRVERRPIVLAEAEGQVLENEPAQQRPDVIREDYRDPVAELPAPGQAKLLLQRFTSPNQNATPKKDAKAAILAEVAAAAESGTPSVIENVPDRRPDVLREEDTTEEVWLRKGYTRDLAGFWSSSQQQQWGENQGPRQPIELPRDDTCPSVFENQPSKLDDSVVRAGEYVEVPVAVEKGRAKTMVNMWQNRQDDTPAKPRQPIQLVADDATVGAGVYENAPVEREGVVRSTDQVEEVMGQRGLIRNLSERFASQNSSETSARRGPVPDMVVIDRAAGPSVLENTPAPVRPDVVRSDQEGDVNGPKVEPGMTRNLVACWKNKEFDIGSAQPSVCRPMELDLAKEAGVFENQPEVRNDVIRALDEETEMISVAQTRSTRALWSQKEQEVADASAQHRKYPREPVRFTPPREKTPPNLVQEDYRSYQTLTLSSSNTPGSTSPAPSSVLPISNHSSGGITSPKQQPQLEQDSQLPVTMTSSAVLVLKSC